MREALNGVVEHQPRWGFWLCDHRLRLLGQRWNHKRVYRVDKAMKLNLPRRAQRRLPQRVQQPMGVAARANAEWAMDFMADTLYHGRRFRTLHSLDEGVREALAIVHRHLERRRARGAYAGAAGGMAGPPGRDPCR